jgi:GNAT superfamily N-acetyltransferase
LTIANVYQKLRRNFSDYGFSRGLTKSLRHVVRPAYQNTSYRIYGIDVQATPPCLEEDERFQFRTLVKTDHDGIQQVEAMAEWFAGELGPRIAAGSICLTAWEGGRVAAFNLVSLGAVEIPSVRLRWDFAAGQAWSEHINTHKEFRQLGLGRKIRQRAFAELRRRGVQWFYGGTLGDHPATLKLAKSLGFTELGDLCYRRLAGRENWFFQRFTNGHAGRIPSPFHGIDQLSADQLSLQ